MTDTLPNITILAGQWVDLYSLSGIGVGSSVIFENVGTCDLYYSNQLSQPSPDHDSYNIVRRNGDPVQIPTGVAGLWAFCGNSNGKANISRNLGLDNFQRTAYGELSTSQLTPVLQMLAVNGLTNKLRVLSFLSGTATTSDSEFTVSTGTTTNSFASILSAMNITYRAGQGALCRISARFSPGAAGTLQEVGFSSSTDALSFVFFGTTFGILRRFDGRVDIHELQITSATTGAGDVTVTVDDIAYTVPVTVDTVQANADEISESLNSQVPNFLFTANDDTVVSRSDIAEPKGVFSFALDTAVGTDAVWTQVAAGVNSTFDFTPQQFWNVDTKPGLDHTKGNVYQIRFKYLGYGAITFWIENPETGILDLVHIIKYANQATSPSLGDPSMPLGWTVASFGGSTENVTLSGASGGLFNEGENFVSEPPRSLKNTVIGVGITPVNLITIRNRLVRGQRRNRVSTSLLEVSGLTTSTKGAIIDVILNADITGSRNYQYVDKTLSNTEYDISAGNVTGGVSVGVLTLTTGSTPVLNLAQLLVFLDPFETVTLATNVVQTPVSDNTGTIIFREDI